MSLSKLTIDDLFLNSMLHTELQTRLVAAVRATNAANNAANKLEVELLQLFAPYVGKKVIVSGGSLFGAVSGTRCC